MTLADQLRGFHDAVTGAAPLDSARALVRARDDADARARLHVYAYAYLARLRGVLADDYPKLRARLGAGAFDALVEPYLRAHPTRAPSLREAGAHLAAFLAAHAGDRPALADLARLERARLEVFDGPDAAPLAREDLAALDPEAFPRLALALVPAGAVVELTTNADDVWDAIEDGREAPPDAPAPDGRAVVAWRRDLVVIHRTLEPDEARALRPLARAGGATFGDVCETLAGDAAAVERALALLLRWLDAGMLTAS